MVAQIVRESGVALWKRILKAINTNTGALLLGPVSQHDEIAMPWSIEAPSVRRSQAGVSPEAQAAEAFAASQRILSVVS